MIYSAFFLGKFAALYQSILGGLQCLYRFAFGTLDKDFMQRCTINTLPSLGFPLSQGS
jgi:hypothetical protein